MTPQRLGQHFLTSVAWRGRIAERVLGASAIAERASGAPAKEARANEVWIEIGAGHGEMTLLLAPLAGRWIAVELDPVLLRDLLRRSAGLANVSVIAGDILALDLSALAGAQRFYVYGNLPYYITSPIVHRLLEGERLAAAFLVVQLEVAARMTAAPGGRDYGYFSAFTQFYCTPEILLRIPPGAFQPPPKVSSALIALHPPGERAALGIKSGEEGRFVKFLKICFAQKRKMLRNNLRAIIPQEQASAVLRECGVEAKARAEELELAQFARIFTALEAG